MRTILVVALALTIAAANADVAVQPADAKGPLIAEPIKIDLAAVSGIAVGEPHPRDGQAEPGQLPGQLPGQQQDGEAGQGEEEGRRARRGPGGKHHHHGRRDHNGNSKELIPEKMKKEIRAEAAAEGLPLPAENNNGQEEGRHHRHHSKSHRLGRRGGEPRRDEPRRDERRDDERRDDESPREGEGESNRWSRSESHGHHGHGHWHHRPHCPGAIFGTGVVVGAGLTAVIGKCIRRRRERREQQAAEVQKYERVKTVDDDEAKVVVATVSV